MKMQISAMDTRIVKSGDNLTDFVLESLRHQTLSERCILAVTSKIVSLCENRLVSKSSIEKTALVRKEADLYLGEVLHGVSLTLKEGLLIPSAGIDESNSETDEYILYPEKPFQSAAKLWRELQVALGLKELGILLTDSHTTPLRKGVTGIALSWAGFQPARSLVGGQDLFGREFKMTQINVADALAAATVFAMGEGEKPRPLALVEGADVSFTQAEPDPQELQMEREKDLYFPFFMKFWNEGK